MPDWDLIGLSDLPGHPRRQSLEDDRTHAPAWLVTGAPAYDTRRGCIGEVMAIGSPRGDERQRDRAWLRPMGGGCEWNPLIADLSPDLPHPALHDESDF
ncbi:hypothetical protein [Streptomyces sp. Ac-502]|uniref:hypothetical protein n=1 Tax=Streptomyces sp. Ac-502 TaxID=3342801 RepID=UPI0038628085